MSLAGSAIDWLGAHRQTRFADQVAWQTHLDRIGISALKVTPDPICIATKGTLWGSVQAHGLLREVVIVSDDAGQCDAGQHAICWGYIRNGWCSSWTHSPTCIAPRSSALRALIWRLYDDLKAHRAEPPARHYGELRARFSSDAPASSRSIACSCGCTATSPVADGARSPGEYHSTPTDPSRCVVTLVTS